MGVQTAGAHPNGWESQTDDLTPNRIYTSQKTSRWFSPQARSLLDVILVADPARRATIPQVLTCIHTYTPFSFNP